MFRHPPRGYWAKVSAGKPVVKYRLPRPTDDTHAIAWISPTPERKELESSERIPEPVQKRIDEDLAKPVEVKVAKTLRNPHWLVGRWIDEDRHKQREYRHHRWGLKHEPIDGTEVKKRRLLVLSALLKEWERRGFSIKPEGYGDRQVFLQIRNEKIEFECFEYLRQYRRPLTEEEKRESFRRNQKWRQLKEPTGKLLLRAKVHVGRGVKTEWRDDDDRQVEGCLLEVIEGLVTIGALLEERSKQRAEEERKQAIAEMARYEEDRKRKKDAARFQHVRDLAGLAEEAGRVRRFLDQLELNAKRASPNGTIETEVADWLKWARRKTEALDPLNADVAQLLARNGKINEWNYKGA